MPVNLEYIAYLDEASRKAKSSESQNSISQIAREHGVNRTSLQNRKTSRESIYTAKQTSQHLSPDEEQTLVSAIERLCDGNWSLEKSHIQKLAEDLVAAREDVFTMEFGHNWIDRLLEHHPSLKKAWSLTLLRVRANAHDADALCAFLEHLREFRTRNRIKRENCWNVDEKGVLLGQDPSRRIIVRWQYLKSDRQRREVGNRELATIIECISMMGRQSRLAAILKGNTASSNSALLEAGVEQEIYVTATHSGWPNQHIFLRLLRDVFEPETRPRGSEPRLLLLDGHGTHLMLETLQFAMKHRIFFVCLPPHSTHLLQPLDLGCFSAEAHWYKEEVNKLTRGPLSKVSKAQFLKMLLSGRERALRSRNIYAGWRDAGIEPYAPEQIRSKLPKAREITPPRKTSTDPQTPRNKRQADAIIDNILSRASRSPYLGRDIAKLAEGVLRNADELAMSKDRKEGLRLSMQARPRKRRKLPGKEGEFFTPNKIQKLGDKEDSKQRGQERKEALDCMRKERLEELIGAGELRDLEENYPPFMELCNY